MGNCLFLGPTLSGQTRCWHSVLLALNIVVAYIILLPVNSQLYICGHCSPGEKMMFTEPFRFAVDQSTMNQLLDLFKFDFSTSEMGKLKLEHQFQLKLLEGIDNGAAVATLCMGLDLKM